MKKYILLLLFALIPIVSIAKSSDWIEVQVVRVPRDTPLYSTKTESGDMKYTLRILGYGIPVSKTNAEKYLSGAIDLEVVKWYNKATGKYKYTTRQYKPSHNIDLQTVFKE